LLCLGQVNESRSANLPLWLLDHRRQSNHDEAMNNSVNRLLSSLFYIELIGVPLLVRTTFRCRAQIRCRISPSASLRHLVEELIRTRAQFSYRQQHILCIDEQLYGEVVSHKEAFSRRFDFSIISLRESIDIKLEGITTTGESLSNCPYMVDTLVQDQGLHCVFGHKDHQRRYRGGRTDM
jgi:hypothetical protein